jgi:hypothetical protein
MKAKPKKHPRKKHMEPNQTTSFLKKDLGQASVKILSIIGGVVVLLIILGAFEYWHMDKIPAVIAPQQGDPRIEKLQQLEASSKPVTATPAQRTTELQKLQASSKPVTATPAQRLAKLQALEKASH